MTSIQMPQLGETIIEGTILKWLKAEGETVERDEPLFEISTDKVDTEVPSPVAGTLTKIIVAEGADGAGRHRARRDRFGRGCGAGEADAAAAGTERRGRAAEPTPASRATRRAERERRARGSRPRRPPRPAGAAPTRTGARPRAAVADPLAAGAPARRRSTASTCSTVAGTGTGGRITKQDVMAVVASGGGGAAASPAASSLGACA